MKQKRHPASKRSRSAEAARKADARHVRPLHKRILLHPFSVMVLLCVGVLVVGSTFRSVAATYDLTATVPAPIPDSPAIIQQPTTGTYFTTKPAVVTGTCTAQSYVKLYRNNALSGVAACGAALTFQIQTDLSVGPNEMKARIFNVTDQEGPNSLPVTVYYALPEPPLTPPASLKISGLENTDYRQGAVQEVSVSPTISGLAPAYSDITVTFHSVVSTCKTKADARGVWICTLANELVLGLHQVDVVAVTPEGQTLVFPSFKVLVKDGQPTLKQARPSIVLKSEYQYQVKKAGELFEWQVGVSGGTPPYSISVDWGDDVVEQLGHPDQSLITLSHAYSAPRDYPVLVTITDAAGTSATMQWVAIVKDSLAYAAFVSTHKGGVGAVLDTARQWLWIVWPVYIAVVLMVLSYWIGEQEGARRLMFRRVTPAKVPVGKGKSR